MRLSASRVITVSACALALVALAGCKKSGGDTSAGVAGQAAAATQFQPGQWDMAMKLDRMEMAGMSPEGQAMMQKSMGTERHITVCLTPEQASRPSGEFFNKGATGCSYDHFSLSGGKLDAAMTCQHQGQKMTMVMTGTYASDHYQAHTTTRTETPGMQPMVMEMTMSSRRVGECTGKEDGAQAASSAR